MKHATAKRGAALTMALAMAFSLFPADARNAGKVQAAETAAPAAAAPAAESDWNFTWFGTSTKEITNTLVQGTGIADGTDLSAENNATVSMTSCTHNADGSIAEKGGKFLAGDGYDGISFYYTKVAAKTENFYLQADVKVDYINPTPDGQEGFALLARDSIGEDKVAESAFYTNSCATIGTKLPDADKTEYKDIVGYRTVRGVTDAVKAPDKHTAQRGGFIAEGKNDKDNLIKAGNTYTVSLEETDSAYIMKYYDKNGGEVLGEYTEYKDAAGDDFLEKMDKKYEYVGFAVARGCDATFSNIRFTKTAADDAKWEKRPDVKIPADYRISSPATAGTGTYNLVFSANADGRATVKNDTDGTVVQADVEVKANERVTVPCEIKKTTTFSVEFTPNADYRINDYTVLDSYETQTVKKEVTYRTFSGSTIYVSPKGKSSGKGTAKKPVDLVTALNYAKAGQTVQLAAGTYKCRSGIKIERGHDGTAEKYITVTTDPSSKEYAVLDFSGEGSGLEIWGNYWKLKKLNITNSTGKGCQVSGDYNVIKQVNLYNNGNTGLQVSGTSAEKKPDWPAYNLIKDCTSLNNADAAMEDADGFAAKLTTGDGNVFDGCVSAYNADDGWDLFAKTESGEIGAVTIKNCVAYRNGFLIVDNGKNKKLNVSYVKSALGLGSEVTQELSFDGKNYGKPVVSGANVAIYGTAINAGNGNGFKMGGSGMPGAHVLKNSISYENKAKGIDSNSGSNIRVYNSTSYNNGGANLALYSNNKVETDFVADGVISFRQNTDTEENIKLYAQKDLVTTSDSNYLWNKEKKVSENASGEGVSKSAFVSLDTDKAPTRKKDGAIDMHGLLALSSKAPKSAGADFSSKLKETTLWVAGDSTVCGFTDKYYIPRYGWGTQLSGVLNYNVNVENLAVSGTSSKSFLTHDNYKTLTDGMAKGDYLMLGFGHNDEKVGDNTFTSGSGDYKTAGSFANSLYENYIRPAQEKGVEVILVTPVARRSAAGDYSGQAGHITDDGDYAQAVRDLGAALKITVCDLTAQTVELNKTVDADTVPDNDSKYMHAWTSKKEASVDNTHTNLFGAAENAYLIAQDLLKSDSTLKAYVKEGLKDPVAKAAAWFNLSINEAYEEPVYNQPSKTSGVWESFTDANNNTWYGSVFGDVGKGSETDKEKFYLGKDAAGNMNIRAGITGNVGKIAGTSDGIAMYYVRIPAGAAFSLKADVTLNGFNAAGKPGKQQAFGLMVRDDMYVDEYVSSTMGDYVAAGLTFQDSNKNMGCNTFARKAGVRVDGAQLAAAPAAGDTVSLELASTTDGYSAKYGANDAVIEGYDFALNAVDGDYVYVGFFAARSIDISVSNIELTVNGQQVKDYTYETVLGK